MEKYAFPKGLFPIDIVPNERFCRLEVPNKRSFSSILRIICLTLIPSKSKKPSISQGIQYYIPNCYSAKWTVF